MYSQLDIDRLKNTIDEDWSIFNNGFDKNKKEEDDFDKCEKILNDLTI